MTSVRFTHTIQRHVACPPRSVEGATVAEVLDRYFTLNDRGRAYVLDDQGGLRHHMAVFVDGSPVRDRARLTDSVRPDSVVDVWQAVSGG